MNSIFDKLLSRASIKGILALAIGIGGFGTLAQLALMGNEQALETLKAVVLALVSFYFGQESVKS